MGGVSWVYPTAPARWRVGLRGPGCLVCPAGPGRCVCRWAAARPRDRHTRACGSEWSISRPALALPPPTGTAAWPSGPSGALHASGTWCADVCLCVVSKPGQAPSLPGGVTGPRALSFWGALVRVVTNVVNPRAFSLKMVVFGLRLTTFVTEVLARRLESRWFDDVCNVGRPLVAWPGPATAHGYRIWVL